MYRVTLRVAPLIPGSLRDFARIIKICIATRSQLPWRRQRPLVNSDESRLPGGGRSELYACRGPNGTLIIETVVSHNLHGADVAQIRKKRIIHADTESPKSKGIEVQLHITVRRAAFEAEP
jgi:hypothetical protein